MTCDTSVRGADCDVVTCDTGYEDMGNQAQVEVLNASGEAAEFLIAGRSAQRAGLGALPTVP